MAKKVEKAESCSCENCSCGKGCCGGKILIVLLAIVWVIAACLACFYSCKALKLAEKSYDLSIIPAGGEDNLNKLMDMYKSEAYVKYATEQTDSQIESFYSIYWDSNTNENNEIDDSEIEDVDNNTNKDPEGIKAVVEDMLASTPIRGDANARFTIVEYTELLCPYCQRHSSEGTINAVIEQFPWEVNSISRHFIIHGDEAQKLASAMECIAELNPSVYNEVFEKAFEAYPVDMDKLISIASEAGTDETALKSCVDEGRYMQAVTDMMNQGNELFGVNGTPGNVIIDRETWKYELISGAYPFETFVETINKMKNA